MEGKNDAVSISLALNLPPFYWSWAWLGFGQQMRTGGRNEGETV